MTRKSYSERAEVEDRRRRREIMSLAAKLVPLNDQLVAIGRLTSELHEVVIAAASEGRTDRKSLDALIADLGQMVEGMRGTWAHEAKCSCGLETRTGGCTEIHLRASIDDHKAGIDGGWHPIEVVR